MVIVSCLYLASCVLYLKFMSFFNTNKQKKTIYALIFIVVILVLVYFGHYFKAIFASADSIREWVLQFGVWAPAAALALEAGQVIIAPLNNFFTNFAAGYIFGPWLGTLYSYVGWIVGAIAVFWFCRIFGRGFVSLFIKEDKLHRFDAVMARGQYVIFMLLLLPGPPDDFIVYLIGLTKGMSWRAFLWMILASKLPGKLATAFLGAGVAEHSTIAFIIYAVFIIASGLVYWLKPGLWQLWHKKNR